MGRITYREGFVLRLRSGHHIVRGRVSGHPPMYGFQPDYCSSWGFWLADQRGQAGPIYRVGGSIKKVPEGWGVGPWAVTGLRPGPPG
jgi:hypothetical protein